MSYCYNKAVRLAYLVVVSRSRLNIPVYILSWYSMYKTATNLAVGALLLIDMQYHPLFLVCRFINASLAHCLCLYF